MVDFAIPDEMRLLVETTQKFIQTEVQPLEEEVERLGHVPPDRLKELQTRAKGLGLFAMNMPVEVGGGGLSTVEMAYLEEQLGQTSDALIRRIFGQVYEMLLACKGEQRERYLLPTVRGERICCMAITEPGAGSDAASITTTATRDGDDFALNGRKHFISDGDIADYAIVMGVTDKERRARGGITLFLVDKGTPGFSVGRVQPMMGHRGYGHAELLFENCRVPASHVLGELGEGFRLIMSSVSRVRLLHIGARSVGMASRLLSMCSEYANERHQFGHPIGDFQMIQQHLADMATEIYATRMMVLNAAWQLDQALDCRDKVSMVKVYAAEMMGRAADRALQIFGGMGFARRCRSSASIAIAASCVSTTAPRKCIECSLLAHF